MTRLLVLLAVFGLVACKSSTEQAGAGGGVESAPASEGHAGIQDATAAFAAALATGDARKIRSQMPPRAALATYFACDTIGKRIDAAAERALTTASPKGSTFIGLEDTKTNIIETELDGCRVSEQILVVDASTRWQLGDKIVMSEMQLVRLGKRWYTFDLPQQAPTPPAE